MIRILSLTFIAFIGLIYWGEFIMINPFKSDLKVICESISNKDSIGQRPTFLHNESKQVYNILKKLPKESQKEILQDFAKSKKLILPCLF